MIRITLEQFYRGKYDDNDRYELYVVRSNQSVLYIGISRNNVYNRWFGPLGRLKKNAGGYWFGSDSISNRIIERMPNSWNYTIELFTLKDCKRFLDHEISSSPYRRHRKGIDIEICEALMVKKLKPSLNVIYNS